MSPIHRLLVANRGEIARRIFRSCANLGITSLAVFSDADADAPFVREADVALRIGPAPVAASYLDPDRILAAAATLNADAIHPGYGFLSESAAFARAVEAAGLRWVGPTPEAIEAMGDKARARALATELGVPIVPGYSGDDLSSERLREEAERIGTPLLIKASAGGGGRGMRRVDHLDDFQDALDSAKREALQGFGSDRVLLERYITRPRHIEVQVLGDAHGSVVHLFERECSIQRRHQKVVEEAPAPGLSAELRDALGEAACTVARSVSYRGAGTVEFILAEDGSFYFLEMNTRLQVEHPVTELVTGTDLVALQIAVAEGAPLPFTQDDLALTGHAIEVRLYAEDPLRDYLPATGPVRRFYVPAAEGIRVDSALEDGGEVGPNYDPMIAKIIASGPTRAIATRRLARALRGTWVPGLVTNLPLLREISLNPFFLAGELHTGFLPEQGLPTPPPLNLERGAAIATALLASRAAASGAWHAGIPSGFRIEGPAVETEIWRCGVEECAVQWRWDGPAVRVTVAEQESVVQLLHKEGDSHFIDVDGTRFTARALVTRDGREVDDALQDGDLVTLHLGDGEAMVQLVPRLPAPQAAAADPGTAVAPTPGTVVAVRVSPGDTVSQSDVLVVLEAMKMEHSVVAAADGTVASVRVSVGDAIAEGAVLVKLSEE